MVVLDADAVRRLLPLERSIELVRDAMRALSNGQSAQILRQILPVPGGIYGIMGGVLPETYGAKLLTAVKHGSAGGDVPSHQGIVVLFDPRSGAPEAVIDATAITGIRTAAASAVATDCLARPDAAIHAVFGTGEQAHAHALAISLVRPIRELRLWGRNREKSEGLARELRAVLQVEVVVCDNPDEASAKADVLSTVTAADQPFLNAGLVSAGAHVNAVGSSRAGPREIADDLVLASRFFGDSRDSVLSQGAEFVQARAAGSIDDSHFLAEIGEVLAGRVPGRCNREEITLYKSLGHIVQDLAAAHYVALAHRQAIADVL